MNINTLTIKAQEALQSAFSIASAASNQAVEPMHILSALIAEDDALDTYLLARIGVNVQSLRRAVQDRIDAFPKVSGSGDNYFSQASSRAIQKAVDYTSVFADKFASVDSPSFRAKRLHSRGSWPPLSDALLLHNGHRGLWPRRD